MKDKLLAIEILLAILLALSAGLGAAQGPAPQGPGSPQAMVGTAFTYQGELRKDGSPITATCAMTFTLYDDPVAGTRVSMPINTPVNIRDGLFTVVLDFGPNSFTGDARWLQVAVLCPRDPSANTLSPRQALTAAPYALSLRPGAEVSGDLPGEDVLQGNNTATSGTSYGLHGQSDSPSGAGVVGWNTATTGTSYGVRGVALSTGGRGVYGLASAASGVTYGVYGEADSGAGTGVEGTGPHYGVRGVATDSSGYAYGVIGQADSTQGFGVYGLATASSGETYGVWGQSASTAGIGVRGFAGAASGATCGVCGEVASPDGRAVVGHATAANGDARGVYGISDSNSGVGVYGLATSTSGAPMMTSGVYGEVYGIGSGVFGHATSGDGVWGVASEGGTGVRGEFLASTGIGFGVYGGCGQSPDCAAGYFGGRVHVVGDLTVGGNKAFRIDDPRDPANRYLYHYSVESPAVLNQYSGNVVLGDDGSAWVELPDYFGALNTDYRYQLTCIGGYAPLYVAQEVQDNRFLIAGGQPGLKVSWLITALRNDPYMQRYGAPVEVEKPAAERGTYLHPELYGQPEELGLNYRFNPGRPDAALGPDTAP